MRPTRWTRLLSLAAIAAVCLTGCAIAVDGHGSTGNAGNVNLGVLGVDPNSSFDQLAQNSLSDVEGFWRVEYPTVSGGKSLPPIKGGLYSVDGRKVIETRSAKGQPVENNQCAQRSIGFLVDNAAYCRLDDSIVWDRIDTHLFGQLAKKYGDFTVALIFAHEFGHAVQNRLGIFDSQPKTIFTESQADCAAGAWAKSAVDGRDPHFRDITLAKVDDALEGFLNGRDSTPVNVTEISHGNGFDRLSAVADGYDKGVTYCYSKGYFDSRVFTERPFRDQQEASSGDNTPFEDVIKLGSDNVFVNDLNRFWTTAAKRIGKTFKPVTIAEAAHPKCGGASSVAEFGYCPDDNTVYFSQSFAKQSYYSLPDIQVNKTNGDVTLLSNQPADFALGTMFSIAWGYAVRHQFFGRSMDGSAALIAGLCYTGAYAKDINVAPSQGAPQLLLLSPADLDEGVAATLDVVPRDAAFGAQGTTGLNRVQAFIEGYKSGLSVC
ncbi:MAG: neutral zinc metallopeptidase [Jatrophihabitans sp.]